MFVLMKCTIHKIRFPAAVGFGPITRTEKSENPRINELDMQHPNAPSGFSRIRYSVGRTCKKGCFMDKWKFIKEISEKEYFEIDKEMTKIEQI